MLNPTEVHLLVGLLVKVSSPDAVDFVAGSPQHDAAAGELRDIDITCKRPAGELLVLRGIEVKRHKRPLTVEQVEQLCIKFKDIPAIAERFVVSASGYTKGAEKKARAHGVELLDFRVWDGRMPPPGNRAFAKDFKATMLNYQVEGAPRIVFNPTESIPPGDVDLSPTAPVLDAAGTPLAHFPTIDALSIYLVNLALNAFRDQDPDGPLPPSAFDKPMSVAVTIEAGPHVRSKSGPLALTHALVTGTVRITPTVHTPEMMALFRVRDDKPLIGCAVYPGLNGGLMGLTLEEATGKISIVNIAMGTRLLSKVKNLPL